MEFALVITHEGQVIEIFKDDFNFFQINVALIHKVDVYSRGKFLNFLKEVQKHTFLSDWELNILFQEELIGVKFTGIYTHDTIIVTGTSIKSSDATFLDEFSELNNQQNTFLREQIKELHKIQSSQKNDWIVENTALKKEISYLKKELIERNNSNELLSNDVTEVKNQLSKLKEDYFEVSDEIRSSLQLLQRDYELCVQKNEDQIFEIKDILDRYDQVFEEEI